MLLTTGTQMAPMQGSWLFVSRPSNAGWVWFR
jgi:hypothetical protein